MNFFLILLSSVYFLQLPKFSNTFPEAMFIGLENKIELVLNGVNPQDVSLKVNEGSLYKRNDSTYIFVPQNPSDEVKVKLYYKKVLCEIKTTSIRNYIEAMPYFDVEKNNMIKKADLDKIEKLILSFDKSQPESLKPSLYSCNVFLSDTFGNMLYSTTIRGNLTENHVLQTIKNLKKGNKITINNVLYQNKSGEIRGTNIQREILITD